MSNASRLVASMFLACAGALFAQGGASAEPDQPLLTDVRAIRALAPTNGASSYGLRLQGVVLWTSPDQDGLILQDDTGSAALHFDLRRQPYVRVGDKVAIQGRCIVQQPGAVAEALLDNDGVHTTIERALTTYLEAGLHPLSVEWFNGPGQYELDVDWAVPSRPRQRIPDSALFHRNGAGAALEPGLNYSCYEGLWERLPDFSALSPVRSGVIPNFDLTARSRDTAVGLAFAGYLEAPVSGNYTFWTKSDDGSRLSLDDIRFDMRVLGRSALPHPRHLVLGEAVPPGAECEWSEAEGVVAAIREQPHGVSLDLSAGTGRAEVRLPDDAGGLLLHCRIKAAGVAQNIFNASGQTSPSLLTPRWQDISILEMPPERWAEIPLLNAHSLDSSNAPPLARVSGTAVAAAAPGQFLIEDDTGRAVVEGAGPLPRGQTQVEAIGWLDRDSGNVVLRNGLWREVQPPNKEAPGSLPLLTRVIDIIGLNRAEALRGYPVKIRGVVTARQSGAVFLQDATRSVYVAWDNIQSMLPRIGEYWEIEGKTSAHFAPDVQTARATYLGPADLPEPIHPTWAELANGSLATRYVELQGIATRINGNELTLLTADGKLKVLLSNPPQSLPPLTNVEGARIRLRGVCSPDRDTNQMMLPRLLVFSPSLSVDQPRPAYPFDTPLKRASDLWRFDTRADALRLVRIAGQILGQDNGEYFLIDGDLGLRFELQAPLRLEPGDLVEAVGYPDMSGSSPVLRDAVARATGRKPLPAPRLLAEGATLNGKFDATRAVVRARLIGLNTGGANQTLELQAGSRIFLARLPNGRGILSNILPESLLEVTGTYAGHGGDRAAGREIDSFELLLNSPDEVRVLARPSWWTTRHALAVIGGLAMVILVALIWITLLHREVEERSRQLAVEIKGREHAERRRALEEERARIARDLHDDMGATLTEIRFLSAVEGRQLSVPQTARDQLMKVSEKARQLVASLDEIVWALNPENDSLPSLSDYLCHVTEEFFRATDLRCRLDVDESLPRLPLNSEIRHSLFLVVREALNNIAKHSGATEAWLRIHSRDHTLCIMVEDNGCGFARGRNGTGGNGLANMSRRLEKLGGRFECDTRLGAGTTCRIVMPFN